MADASGGKTQEKVTFDWQDPLLLENQLSDEERMIRDAARGYCQDKLMPRVISANREERFDREIMTELGEQGLLGATVAEEFGGGGASTSRLPFDCNSPTTPARSISSTMRAARL